MKRRIWFGTAVVAAYLAYVIVIVVFFSRYEANAVPASLVGGPADPATFMTEEQLQEAQQLSRIRYLSTFILTPLDLLLLFLFLLTGLSAAFRRRAEALFKRSFPRVAVYFLLFQILATAVRLPIQFGFYRLDVRYGLSDQPVGSWFSDQGLVLLVNTLIMLPVVWLAYWVVCRSPKRWWLWGWISYVPVLLFVHFIQPVVLDPLFNQYQPLRDEALRQEIMALVEEADVPIEHVVEADMSKQTNRISAHVAGFGATSRVVLWDTALKQVDRDGILFLVAHEVGHYVKRHILWFLVVKIALVFVTFRIVYELYRWAVRRWSGPMKLTGAGDMAALPIILLFFMLVGFALSPVEMAVIRMQEQSADEYALELTGDGEAGVRLMQAVVTSSLSDVNLPWIYHFFYGSHPEPMERIVYMSGHSDE